jgi:Mrp family chromosome partitioning ATPase/capsular polysaccharide biosynthesis protein
MNNEGHKLELAKRRYDGVFGRVWRAILKRIKVVAALPVLMAVVVWAVATIASDPYQAHATIQIGPWPEQTFKTADGEDFFASEQRDMERAIEAVRSKAVIDRVVDELDLADDPEFALRWPASMTGKLFSSRAARHARAEAAVYNRLSVSRLRHTLLLRIGFSSADAAKAARMANAIARAFLVHQADSRTSADNPLPSAAAANGKPPTASEKVFKTLLVRYGKALQLPDARIVKEAKPPRNASTPGAAWSITIAAAAGLAVAIVLAFLLELRATGAAARRLRTFSCPHMTSVPAMAAHRPSEKRTCFARLVLSEPNGPYADAIRTAFSALQQSGTEAPSRLVLVTSALPGEGAEHFASNLAHHAAVTGSHALLIDADLRIKALTRQLADPKAAGLLNQIASRQSIEDAILRDDTTGLHFLPASGKAPVALSAHTALRSLTFADGIRRLKIRFSTIVVSAPPLLSVTDAQLLAQFADQIIFVTAWHKTPPQIAQKALASLGTNKKKLAGAVLSGSAAGDDGTMTFSEIFSELRWATPFARHAA